MRILGSRRQALAADFLGLGLAEMKDAEIDGFVKMKVLVDVDVAIAHGICDDLGWVWEIKEATIGGLQFVVGNGLEGEGLSGHWLDPDEWMVV